MCKIFSCNVLPWAIGYISGDHQLGHLVLGADCTSPDIVSSLCIYVGSVHCCSDEELHLFYSSIALWRSARVPSNNYEGMHMQSPFSKMPFSMDSSSWAPQNCQVILRTWLMHLGHQMRVRQYRVLWIGSCLMASCTMFSLSAKKCTCWILW